MLTGNGERAPALAASPARLVIRLAPTAVPLPAGKQSDDKRPSHAPSNGQRPGKATVAPATVAIADPPRASKATPSEAVDARDLIDRGKAMLNQASRRQALDPMFARPAANTLPAPSPLARDLALPAAGERLIGGQIYQYTTADGHRFCVTPPLGRDMVNRDGPAGAGLLVATNCPR